MGALQIIKGKNLSNLTLGDFYIWSYVSQYIVYDRSNVI